VSGWLSVIVLVDLGLVLRPGKCVVQAAGINMFWTKRTLIAARGTSALARP
jgi:hypothetical protein